MAVASTSTAAAPLYKTPAASSFRFSNLCGTVYKQGNVVFTPDGNSVISPVGNRVSVFDLVKSVPIPSLPWFLEGWKADCQHLPPASNKSRTLAFENRKNIARIALSPDATVLISVDEGAHPGLPPWRLADAADHHHQPVHTRRWPSDPRQLQAVDCLAPLQLQKASPRYQVLARRKVSRLLKGSNPIHKLENNETNLPAWIQVHRRDARVENPGVANAFAPRPRIRPLCPPPRIHRPLRRRLVNSMECRLSVRSEASESCEIDRRELIFRFAAVSLQFLLDHVQGYDGAIVHPLPCRRLPTTHFRRTQGRGPGGLLFPGSQDGTFC